MTDTQRGRATARGVVVPAKPTTPPPPPPAPRPACSCCRMNLTTTNTINLYAQIGFGPEQLADLRF